MERCPECGFVYLDLPREHIVTALAMVAAQYRSRLGSAGWMHGPTPDRWSPAEYAAHVRDLLDDHHRHIALTLRFDRPTIPVHDRSGSHNEGIPTGDDPPPEDDPARMARSIEQGADRLASLLATLSEEEWQRVAVVAEPGAGERDVVWMGRNAVHELAHHLLDISRTVDPATASASG